MITAHRAHSGLGTGNAPPTTGRTKVALSTMGKLFVAILLVAVFEGGVRKWVSVDYTVPLVLLRDCLAVYGIFLSIQSGKLAVDQKIWQGLWLWSALVLCWGLGQLIINQSSPLAFIVGLRFWLLYVWFAYAAAAMLTADDFRYITKTILWILVFLAPLAVVQFYLPPTAFLNKQLDDDELAVFLVAADIVRTTGTFSFALGYSTFLAIANPFVLALLAPGGLLKGNKWLPSVLILVLAVATIVSGSRGALIMFGLMVVVYIAVTLGHPKAARQGNVLPQLLAMLLILAVVPYVFFGAVDAMEQRIEIAAEAEDFSERISDMFFGESSAYEKLTFLGHGIGGGNNFAAVEATGERGFLLAETETARAILEGGLIGFIFIGLKWIVIFSGLLQSWRIVRSSGDTLPLMLWVTLAIALSTWSIIGQLSMNVLGCLLLGLGLASLRLGGDRA